MGKLRLSGKPIIAGSAKGAALVSTEPLSFWGGYDWKSGEITDRRHPLSGANAKGKVLAIPFTRGSSTTTAVLLEAIRAKTAPSAIITTSTDFFFCACIHCCGRTLYSATTIGCCFRSRLRKLTNGRSN